MRFLQALLRGIPKEPGVGISPRAELEKAGLSIGEKIRPQPERRELGASCAKLLHCKRNQVIALNIAMGHYRRP